MHTFQYFSCWKGSTFTVWEFFWKVRIYQVHYAGKILMFLGNPSESSTSPDVKLRYRISNKKKQTKCLKFLNLTAAWQRLEELQQPIGHAPDDVTRVPILRQQEWELEVGIFLQLDVPSVRSRQFVGHVLCHSHHLFYQRLRNRWLIRLGDILLQQSPELEGVQLKAGGADVGYVVWTALRGL